MPYFTAVAYLYHYNRTYEYENTDFVKEYIGDHSEKDLFRYIFCHFFGEDAYVQ